MKKFSIEIDKNASYATKRIGEKIRSGETSLIITNIVDVAIEDSCVIIRGYGIEIEY